MIGLQSPRRKESGLFQIPRNSFVSRAQISTYVHISCQQSHIQYPMKRHVHVLITPNPWRCQSSTRTAGASSCRRPQNWRWRCSGRGTAVRTEPLPLGLETMSIRQGSGRGLYTNKSWSKSSASRCWEHSCPVTSVSYSLLRVFIRQGLRSQSSPSFSRRSRPYA